MRTSATGISTSRGASCGFSLLELLVVVTIIAIFVGMAVLSVGVAGRDRESEQEAFRLRSLIDLVHEEALMQSRDFGLLFSATGYRFYVYDHQRLAWLEPAGDRLLAEHTLDGPLRLSLAVEDRELTLKDDFDDRELETPEPQIVILSSGEVTPFQAAVYRDSNEGRFTLTAEFDGTMEIAEDGFETR